MLWRNITSHIISLILYRFSEIIGFFLSQFIMESPKEKTDVHFNTENSRISDEIKQTDLNGLPWRKVRIDR